MVGYGVDCLWSEAGNFNAIAFFNFENEGVIVSSGRTSLAPYTPGAGDNPVVPGLSGAPNAAMLTGHFPSEEHTLVETTGAFENYRGRIRLSGSFAVPEGGTPIMNCVWEMDLTLPSSVAIARLSAPPPAPATEAVEGGNGRRQRQLADGESKVQIWQFLGKATPIEGGLAAAKEMAGIQDLELGDVFDVATEIDSMIGCFEAPMRNFVTSVSYGCHFRLLL